MGFKIGCHLSSAGGYMAMGQTAVSIGANVFQFFTRNPRGGAAKPIDPADAKAFRAYAAEKGIGPILAHAPYTLNAAGAEERVREFAESTMRDDLKRLELTPGALYNFHPGSHVGQGAEAGIALIAGMLDRILAPGWQTTVLLRVVAECGDVGLVDGARRAAARIAREELEHVRADRRGGLRHREIAAGRAKMTTHLHRQFPALKGTTMPCARSHASCHAFFASKNALPAAFSVCMKKSRAWPVFRLARWSVRIAPSCPNQSPYSQAPTVYGCSIPSGVCFLDHISSNVLRETMRTPSRSPW